MKLGVLSVIALLVASSASNATMVKTHTASLTNRTFDINTVLSVPKFDPSLGTLQKATLSISQTLFASYGIESNRTDAGQTVTFSLKSSSNFALSVSQGDQTFTTYEATPSFTDFWTLEVYDGTPDFAGPSGASKTYIDNTEDFSQEYTGADLDRFIGTGNLDYNVNGTASITHGYSGGNLSVMFSTLGSANVTVTYEYVPEPATIGLLMLGGLLFVFRRR